MSETRQFYKNLKPFSEFSQIGDDDPFVRVPDDWHVLIADVKGSTQAIREGRYKDVNLVGAAAITCILNSIDSQEIPFVFGGDGASLLVPHDRVEEALVELRGLQALAQKSFRLELRVGHVAMVDLRKLGSDLLIGKYELSPGNYTAQFKGGALVLAEDMIKKGTPEGATAIHPSGQDQAPHLEGLSCRLQPMENRHGVILSLLVRPLGANSEAGLRNLLSELKQILNGDFMSARPVSLERMFWRWPPATFRSEVATQRGDRSLAAQCLQTAVRTLVAAISITFNIPLGPFKPKTYKGEMLSNSDFKKFDETLRMVIDCSLQQAERIERLLQNLKDRGAITFGTHRSAKALMTCMVKSSAGNQHIHFIDGADGGYALAAVQMKAQS